MNTDFNLRDYLSMVKRRWKVMLITIVVVSLVAGMAAFLLPPVYESKGTILIESQQIPTELLKVNSEQFADERIEAIKQRVMTRENLVKLIETYGLFAKEKAKMTVTEMVDSVRDNITINSLSANKGSYGQKSTIAFSVSYEDSKPDITFKVTNEIITLFLSENVKDRTTNASETTEFFEKESQRLRTELEGIEKKVAEFKQVNANSLPEYKEMNLSMIQRLDTSIQDMDREIKTTQEEMRYLDIELAAAKAGIGTQSNPASQPDDLAKLKEEYLRLSVSYTESHPSLRKLKTKIESLEKIEGKPSENSSSIESKDVTEARLRVEKVQAQIASAKIRLDSLTSQKQKMFADLTALQQKVLLSPQVERELTALQRDYENAKTKYDEIKSKQINSKMTVSLEQENKGERFVLIDPPSLPEKPTKPDRKKILALGIFGSIAMAIAIMIMAESIDQRIRTEEQLTEVLQFEPLVVLPYISTYEEIERGKKALVIFVIGAAVFALIALLLIHHFYMPLDVLMVQIMNKF